MDLYLQDALRSSLEASMIPAFEMSCKNMFEQVDTTLQKGLIKHTTAAQQQFESSHSPLAVTLRVRMIDDIFWNKSNIIHWHFIVFFIHESLWCGKCISS